MMDFSVVLDLETEQEIAESGGDGGGDGSDGVSAVIERCIDVSEELEESMALVVDELIAGDLEGARVELVSVCEALPRLLVGVESVMVQSRRESVEGSMCVGDTLECGLDG